MANNIFIFVISLILVIKGAELATKYAVRLAESFRLSKYVVGFIVVAVISILPETFIVISSSLNGVSEFGLGMLFGANVADMTLLFALIVFLTGRSLKVESKILTNHAVYPFILMVPLILGFNGHLSRMEGVALIIIGGIFYYLALRNGTSVEVQISKPEGRLKNILLLLFSMLILLVGSNFTVTSATAIAGGFGISPILIGMLVVGLGTTMPEFFFSLKAVKKHDDSLAIGDLLGTVLADATIVVGILALVNPFSFPQRIVYVTGAFMVLSSFVLFHFMRTGKTLNKREAWYLLAFWVLFVLVEFFVNR